MYTDPSKHNRNQQKAPGKGLRRFLFILILLSLTAIIVCVVVIAQLWRSSQISEQHPTPTPVIAVTPHA